MADFEITKYLEKVIRNGVKAGAWRVDDERWTTVIMFYGFCDGCDEAIMGAQSPEDMPQKLNDLFLRILGIYE